MKASVIVLSWNGMDYLEDCLDAVFSQDYDDFEVIVVDNGSTDGSADFVAGRFPQAQLIRNERNLGFAAGNNVGLRAATGDVLALLNQDTVVQPGWLRALVEALQADPAAGIAGGKALYPDGTIQHAGGYISERGEGIHYGYRQEDEGQFDNKRDVDYVTGATLAITRRAFEAIGELDEGFTPVYFEDADWCCRAREAGFRVVYAPQAVLIHRESGAITDVDYEAVYVFERNRLRFVLKRWPLDRLTDEFLPAERAWLESWGEGNEWLISAVHRAYLYNLLHLSDAITWRQEILGAPLDEADVLANVLLTLRAVIPMKPARIGMEPMAAPEELATPSPPEQAESPPSTSDMAETSPESVPVEEMAAYAPETEPSPFPEAQGSEQAEILKELYQSWAIQEQPFRSDVPIFGPLIAAFRRQWNRVSTVWYVRPMIQQQIKFNARVVTMLEHLARQAQTIADQMNQQENRLSQQGSRLNQQEQDRRRLGEVLAEYIGEDGREIAELAHRINKISVLLEKIVKP